MQHKLKLIFNAVRFAIIRWKQRQLQVERDQVVADFIWAVDYRLFAQREFFERGKSIAERQQLLLAELNDIQTEIRKDLA